MADKLKLMLAGQLEIGSHQEGAMAETFGDWRIVARETNERADPIVGFLVRLLILVPSDPPQSSSVTWTVRHVHTGELRKITANSEDEFAQRLAAGAFDRVLLN
jgi:hypothetical protein